MTNKLTERERKYNELMEAHRTVVSRLCMVWASGDEAVMRNLVHECYVAMWLHFDTLRPGASKGERAMWVVWQCRFARRCYNRYNRLLSVRRGEVSAEKFDDLRVGHRELIVELSGGLTPHEQRILDLMLEGYRPREIAMVLDIKPESVSVEWNRIIKKMRQNADKIYHTKKED